MAGHSKWANIQHRKKAQDAKRGKLFTRLLREVTVAARLGGPDPDANPRLRAAIDKALSNNMPKDNIDRAVRRGAGGTEGEALGELRYEGYAPGGVAVMVDCMTDNRNRTVSEVRYAFNKVGGNLGTDGSVAYLFSHKGVIGFPAEVDEDHIVEAAIEAGAEDVVTHDDGVKEVVTAPNDFTDVKAALVQAGLQPEYAEVIMRPATYVPLGLEDAQQVIKLWEMLEDVDDVQNVYSNADIPDEAMA